MKNLIFVLALVAVLPACKALDAADATINMQDQMGNMLKTTKEMQEETSKLTSAIHLQKMDAALKTIYSPENTQAIVPPSSGLLAGAKVFAEEGTAIELVEYTYVTLKEIDKTELKDSLKAIPAEVEKFNHGKKIKFVALEAIAAQTSTSVVKNIIQEQILGGGGRYEDVAYSFLMLRALFLYDFYLQSGVLGGPLNNMGKLEKAYEYLSQLEFIASQPFADKIAVKTTGILAPEDNFDLSFNTVINPEMKGMWRKVIRSIERDMPNRLTSAESPYARRIAEIREQAQRYYDARQ